MSKNILVDGAWFEEPSPKAPRYAKMNLSIKADRLIAFLEKHKNDKGFVNININESAKGQLYGVLFEKSS